jgi:3-oxoacyl-[acyl-carrier protein] reductase
MVESVLHEKVVLVTGANSPIGIGAATATAFSHQGSRVFVHYWRLREWGRASTPDPSITPADFVPEPYRSGSQASPDELLESIRQRGALADAWEADLSDPANVRELFDRVERALGPVDILVNNAAHWAPDTFLPPEPRSTRLASQPWPPQSLAVTAQSHDDHFAVNSRATALLLGEYARRHLARGARWGRIVSLTTGGSRGFPFEASYGASKSALESYTRAFALELAPYGVTANTLNPGPTQTGWITPELEEKIAGSVPMRRIAQPEEIADLVVLLCSEGARLLTGQRLHALGY